MARAGLLAALFALAAAQPPPPAAQNASGAGWTSYCVGQSCDGAPSGLPTQAGAVVVGGGGNVDAAFLWQLARCGGACNFVVLAESGGTDPLDPTPDPDPCPYNDYLWKLSSGALRSVTTVVLDNKTASFDSRLLKLVATADALWFEGGDQSYYYILLTGTPLGEALQERTRRVTVGGTSAGADWQGDWVFTPSVELPDDAPDVSSEQALADPWSKGIVFGRSALTLGAWGARGVGGKDIFLVDTHVRQRERMGRWLAFGARLWVNGTMGEGGCVRMVALDERSALLIQPGGKAELTGPPEGGSVAHMCSICGGEGLVCARGLPLSLGPLACHELKQGEQFDFAAMAGGTGYTTQVEAGVVTLTPHDWR